MGQTKPVRVFQLIAENTVESRVLDIRMALFLDQHKYETTLMSRKTKR
jgi:SNF2 family DNA or RNA helicase